MTQPQLFYFDQEDILHLVLAEGAEANSIALSPTITAELNGQGEVIGIEIVQARTFLRETLDALVQAHQLPLGRARA